MKSSRDISLVAGGPEVLVVKALGELLALLEFAGLALLGSEFAGVGWSRSADRLALLTPLFDSEFAVLGGDTDCVLGGVRRGVAAGIAGRGPWGFRALVVESRGSIMTACAACSWSWCDRGDRFGPWGL